MSRKANMSLGLGVGMEETWKDGTCGLPRGARSTPMMSRKQYVTTGTKIPTESVLLQIQFTIIS